MTPTFDGSVEAARGRAKEVRAELGTAQARLAEATSGDPAMLFGAAQVRRDPQFERAESVVRRQILAVEVDLLRPTRRSGRRRCYPGCGRSPTIWLTSAGIEVRSPPACEGW